MRNQYALADPDALRLYSIRDERGVPHRAYVVVVSRGRVGQYYDVQGTDWSDAPMFSKPDQTVHVGNRTYELYYEGSNLKMVAWHEFGAVYWIRNTLTDDVPNSEMLAMAEETYPVSVHVAGPGRHRAGVGTYALPPRQAARAPGDPLEKLGAVGAIGAWLALALLAVRYVSDRRELRTLRQQMAHAAALEARQRALAASRGAAVGVPPRPDVRRQTPGPRISTGAPAPPGARS